MPIRMTLLVAAGLFLLAPLASRCAQRTNAGGETYTFANPILVTIVVRNPSGGSTRVTPTVQLHGQTQDGMLYNGRNPSNNGDRWTFEVPGAGTYTAEVSAPGYKTAQKMVVVTSQNENPQIDIAMEPESNPGKAKGATVLAPAARLELDKGRVALAEKHFDDAKVHLEKALQLAPTSPEANYFVGLLYYYTENLTAAVEHLQKTVSMDPGNSLALVALGQTYYMQKDYPHTVSVLEQGLALDPNLWRAEALLGSTYYKQAQYEKCSDHAQKALTIAKEQASGTGFLLGVCLKALGKKTEAIEAFQAFLQQQPPSEMTKVAQQMLKELQETP